MARRFGQVHVLRAQRLLEDLLRHADELVAVDVDQAVRAFRRGCELVGSRHSARAVSRDSARQRFGALVVPVDDEKPLHPEAHRSVGDGRARAPGAEENDLPSRCIAQLLRERPGEAQAIGVEAFALALAEDHRVDGADGARILGQLGEQRQHGLLARVRDVEAVETRRLGRVDQPRQIVDT